MASNARARVSSCVKFLLSMFFAFRTRAFLYMIFPQSGFLAFILNATKRQKLNVSTQLQQNSANDDKLGYEYGYHSRWVAAQCYPASRLDSYLVRYVDIL